MIEINVTVSRHQHHPARRRFNLQLVDKGSADLDLLVLRADRCGLRHAPRVEPFESGVFVSSIGPAAAEGLDVVVDDATHQVVGHVALAGSRNAVDRFGVVDHACERHFNGHRGQDGSQDHHHCNSERALLPGNPFPEIPRCSQIVAPRSAKVRRVPRSRACETCGPAMRNGTYSRV